MLLRSGRVDMAKQGSGNADVLRCLVNYPGGCDVAKQMWVDRHTERGLCGLDDTSINTTLSHWRSPDAHPKRINALIGSKQGPPLRNPGISERR